MADRITISTEEMQTAVSAYETQKGVKMDAIAAMKTAVQGMDAAWDGPASEAFMAVFDNLYGKMMKTEEKMQDAIDELNRIIGRAEEVNADISNLAKAADSMAGSL